MISAWPGASPSRPRSPRLRSAEENAVSRVVATSFPDRRLRSVALRMSALEKRLKKMLLAHSGVPKSPSHQTSRWSAPHKRRRPGEGAHDSSAKTAISAGRSLDPGVSVKPSPDPHSSSCPFCRAGTLLLIGGTRRFLYYQCEACTEVWTVTSFPPMKPQPRQELIRAN